MSNKTSVNESSNSILDEAMLLAEDSKEIFTQHLQRSIVEKFVPRNNAMVSEKLSEMDSDEEDENDAAEEVNELQVSDEDPDADQLDETNVEEDLVPTLDIDQEPTGLGDEGEVEVEPEMEQAIDQQDLIDAIKQLLGLGQPEMEPQMEPADDIEPGIQQQQEEVDENASNTADMDAPKNSEPNAEMGAVKNSSSEAELKKLTEDEIEEETVSEDDAIDIVEDESDVQVETKSSNLQDNTIKQLNKQLSELKSINSNLKNENQQLKEANDLYKNRLMEQKVDLTKLGYLTEIFNKYPINAQMRAKIIERFDSAKTEKDLNNIYEAFSDSLEIGNIANSKKIVVKESAKQIGNKSARNMMNESKEDPFAKFKHITDYKYGQ